MKKFLIFLLITIFFLTGCVQEENKQLETTKKSGDRIVGLNNQQPITEDESTGQKIESKPKVKGEAIIKKENVDITLHLYLSEYNNFPRTFFDTFAIPKIIFKALDPKVMINLEFCNLLSKSWS